LNGTFTASITAVSGATSYVWALPSGLTGSSTGTSITITGATAGSIAASGITVKAKNDCGESAAKAGSGTITVRSCSAAPATPGTITLTATTIYKNGTLTASVSAVPGADSYEWTLPGGLSGTSTQRNITITGITANVYASGTISVKAKNACGASSSRSTASEIKVYHGGEWSPQCDLNDKSACVCASGKSRVGWDSASDIMKEEVQGWTQYGWYKTTTNGDAGGHLWLGSSWGTGVLLKGRLACF
jgi:hypothetical protein